MILPRSSLVVRLGVALFDYALIAVLSAIGTLGWLAACLGFDPDLTHIWGGCVSLIVGWVLLGIFLFWRMSRAGYWRMIGAVTVLATGSLILVWLRSFTLEVDRWGHAADGQYLLILQVGVFLLCLMALFVLRRWALKRGLFLAAGRTVLAAVAVGCVIYLGWDEPEAPSIGRNRAIMAGRSEDEPTRLLTLRYSPAPGGGKVFTPPTHKLDFHDKGEKRREYLLAHRAEIEANWAELAEVRAWWAEMAAQPQLGDRRYASFEEPIMRFAPIRAYTQHALAFAELQALDGNGDEALATVGQVYVVGALLQPAACTLVRGMIATLTQKQSLETAGVVLDHARVSADARVRFAALLDASKGDGIGAKRLILTESTSSLWTAKGISMVGLSAERFTSDHWQGYIARRVSPLTLNPQATVNRLHDQYERFALRAEVRDLAGMDALEKEANTMLFGAFQVKNISGRLLVAMWMPIYSKVVKSYWETEDLRASLAKRLRETPPPSAI